MRTNLAFSNLQSAVDEALQQEEHQPTIRALPQIFVAGIEVDDPRARESKLAERRKAHATYRQDVGVLKERLGDIPYLAIVPDKAWQAIVAETGLIRLAPDKNGAVRISEEPLQNIEEKASARAVQFPLTVRIFGLVATIAAVVLVFAVEGLGAWVTGLLTLAVGSLLTYVLGSLAHLSVISETKSRGAFVKPAVLASIEKGILNSMFSVPFSRVSKLLWPNGVEPRSRLTLRIKLPPAPAEEKAILERVALKGLPTELAVVPEAITLVDDPVSVYIGDREHRYVEVADRIRSGILADAKARREAWERAIAAWRDPIVTTTHGTAVAVLVQYGEYPIEKEVVDRVINSDQLF